MSENQQKKQTLESAIVDTKVFYQILDLAVNNENITTLWLPSSGRTALAYRLQYQIEILQPFKKQFKRIIFIPGDVSLDLATFEDHLEISLEKYSQVKGIMKKINDIISKDNSIYFIIDNFSFKNLDTLNYILSLKQISLQSIRYIFLGLESEFFLEKELHKDFGLLFHNIVKVPYLDREYSLRWIDKCAGKLNVKLTQNEKDAFYEFSGGIIGLLKNCVRVFKRFQDLEQTFNSEDMINYCLNLWQQFSKEEQNILKNLQITGKFNPASKEFIYLKEHKLITEGNKINGKWVEKIVGGNGQTELKVKGGMIIYMGVDLDDVLTTREKGALLFICSQKSLTADRESLGKVIWGNEFSTKYSDWAMDQIFSRLRKKLIKIGMPENIIKTLKGKGFKLQNVKISN